MKRLTELSFSNIKRQASASLVNLTMAVAGCAIFVDEILKILHRAPFPVSPNVDAWVKWIVEVAALIMIIYTALSKKKDVSVDVSVSQATAPDQTALGKQ